MGWWRRVVVGGGGRAGPGSRSACRGSWEAGEWAGGGEFKWGSLAGGRRRRVVGGRRGSEAGVAGRSVRGGEAAGWGGVPGSAAQGEAGSGSAGLPRLLRLGGGSWASGAWAVGLSVRPWPRALRSEGH